jgi:hypothetical protein
MIIDQRQKKYDMLTTYEEHIKRALWPSKRSFFVETAKSPTSTQNGVSINDGFFKISFYVTDYDLNQIILYIGSDDDFEKDNSPKLGMVSSSYKNYDFYIGSSGELKKDNMPKPGMVGVTYNSTNDLEKFINRILDHFEVKR